jgi:hypothetical protein
MRTRPLPLLVVAAALVFALAGSAPWLAAQGTATPTGAWEPLFDGKTLTNWRPSKFFGQAQVRVENGEIILPSGNDLTGITWAGPQLPTSGYELALQAKRVEGSDFFAGITFPVQDSFCSLILGGWGGNVVGLSSINDLDASENSTSQSRVFERDRWYDVRIRVTEPRIEVWLDDKPIIDQELKGNRVGVRLEVEASQPLGIASWRTTGAIRDIRLRRL